MPHDMNMEFSEKYAALRAVGDKVLTVLEKYALHRYGKDFFRIARLCFPGRSADGNVRHENLLLPWAVFSWSPPADEKFFSGSMELSAPSRPLVLDWLENAARAEDELTRRYARAAAQSLFRFLRIAGREGDMVLLEDMLDPAELLKMPTEELPAPLPPDSMIFCQAVTLDGLTIGTHPALDASECTKGQAERARFEALLRLMAREWRASGPLRDGSGRRMLENLLFMHARYCTGTMPGRSAGQ